MNQEAVGIISSLISGLLFALSSLVYNILGQSIGSLTSIFYVMFVGRFIAAFIHDIIVAIHTYFQNQLQQNNINHEYSQLWSKRWYEYCICFRLFQKDERAMFKTVQHSSTFILLAIVMSSLDYFLFIV